MTILTLVLILLLLFLIFMSQQINFIGEATDDIYQCKWVSTEGLRRICDVQNLNSLKNNPTDDIVYVYANNGDVHAIYREIGLLKQKIVLVTGHSDETMPYDIFSKEETTEFLNNDNLIHWYAQNSIINEGKMSTIPIGIDYHSLANGKDLFWGPPATWLEQENELNKIRETMIPFWERKIKCYANFQFHFNKKNDRENAINDVPKDLVFYEADRVVRKESWKNQSEYAFVISPHGLGLDCHRNWEALVLGCIPIVTKSPIDVIFDKLPVLIIDKWSDVTQDLLENTINQFKNMKFEYERILISYWKEKIRPS